MEQKVKTSKSDQLPLELWYKVFHYVRVEDTLQLSLVCRDFKELIENNALWRWYCLKKCASLTLKQVNSFPSCKEFYRDILKPFSWAVGHSFMFPGVAGAGRMCKVRLQDRALVITPKKPEINHQVFLKIESDGKKRRIEVMSHETGKMEEIKREEDAKLFLRQNIVVYFFNRYMRLDSQLLQS